jgi:hopanoid biosynthesis associated RND transporter like protein HpnN
MAGGRAVRAAFGIGLLGPRRRVWYLFAAGKGRGDRPVAGRNDDWVSGVLVRATAWALGHARLVMLASLLVTLVAGTYAARDLGFNLDPNDLFADDLPFQRMVAVFEEEFPVLTNTLIIVVDGDTPEATRAGADAMVERLRARPELFTEVFLPGEEPFFEIYGLLYNDIDDLDTFATQMAQLQPVIGALSREPTLASLTRVIERGLSEWDEDGSRDNEDRWRSVLDHFRQATISVYAEVPVSVSWESVLLEGSPLDPTLRRVIVAFPVLAFERILAAQAPIDAIRAAAEDLPLGYGESVTVRITGYPALNHEEFLGLARDTSLAGTLSFVLVVVVLSFAFRSYRMVTAAAITLVVGFVWTAGYATLAVGRLNPASIAFAVLFIGLGVDFMIHLGMMVVAALRSGSDVPSALMSAARETGSALVLCALSTAIGFLAFLPTDYRGVSELGVISAGGMIVILTLTLTLFPVLVDTFINEASLARLRARRPVTVPFSEPRHPLGTVGVAVAVGLGGAALLPSLDLETNVVALRNPETESVETFLELLDSTTGTPWYLDMLAPDLETADSLAEQVRELETVRLAITLSDYVPEDQDEKLELLEDTAMILDLPADTTPRELPDAETQIEALRSLVSALDPDGLATVPSGLATSGSRLRAELVEFLGTVDGDPDPEAAIEALDARLIAPLAGQFDRLRQNLEVGAISREILPDALVERMLADDGRARVQVFPSRDLGERDAMIEFVESVRPIWPDITGLPVNLVASSYVTWDSLREALLWAVAVIFGLLVMLWRRIVDAGLAVMPLVLAVVLTAAVSALAGWTLNFINVCVLPLLVGIGVDSGVHMVHRSKQLPPEGGVLLESTTAQAVFFSALTTLASFGTLVISDHVGIASLGRLLVVGMLFTLAGNLVVLPALLALQRGHHRL